MRPEVAIALVPRTVRGAYGDGTPNELADWRIELADAQTRTIIGNPVFFKAP